MTINRNLLMTVVAAGAALSFAGTSHATDVISAESTDDNSSKVRIYRPTVSQTEPAPEPQINETRVVVNVPIYVTNRYRRRGYIRRFQGTSLAFGPRYTGFGRLYSGPLYPF
ncbi:MAG: hypothetical protein ACR2OJ_11120 [Hyphomicrobiales bacterium]